MEERAVKREGSARAEGELEEELRANRRLECRATADQELQALLAKAVEDLLVMGDSQEEGGEDRARMRELEEELRETRSKISELEEELRLGRRRTQCRCGRRFWDAEALLGDAGAAAGEVVGSETGGVTGRTVGERVGTTAGRKAGGLAGRAAGRSAGISAPISQAALAGRRAGEEAGASAGFTAGFAFGALFSIWGNEVRAAVTEAAVFAAIAKVNPVDDENYNPRRVPTLILLEDDEDDGPRLPNPGGGEDVSSSRLTNPGGGEEGSSSCSSAYTRTEDLPDITVLSGIRRQL
ncbi:hypothetical protein H6P81_009306 [Aristolochia fimbriata]|uniref:Uncharacterized protein n=1 Tax=Aristolochia fimbriata TaxID=158543 RepID=A0AAV7ENP5_ARIFI|nr:hypothetical protein H6P81_009306 [Aristolochia fimbriata]